MAETGCEEHNETRDETSLSMDNTIGGNSPLEFPHMIKSKKPENGSVDADCKNDSNLDGQLTEKSVSTAMIQEDVNDDVGKLKKKRPFKPAEHLWCFSIEDPRYDFHEPDEAAEHANRGYVNIPYAKPVMSSSSFVWDENCELLADIYSHGRATNVKRSNKEPKVLKQLKDVHYRTKKIKQMNTGRNNKLLVKSDAYSRKVIRDTNMTQAFESKKGNIEKTLEKKELKRRGIKPTMQTTTDQTPSNTKRKMRRKPRWSPERKEDRVIYWEAYPYALNEADLPSAEKSSDDPETQLLWTLIQLQNRDLSPEDYDILLQLDDKVAVKTVCAEKLKALATQTLTDSDLASVEVFEDPCSICMESYEESQIVKFLPKCKHVFHERCIDNWLTNSGTNCPLDGLEVDL